MICTKCKEDKLSSEFYLDRQRNGLYAQCKECHKKRVRLIQDLNKRKLVEAFGGKCVICGYDKHPRILQFHHKNPLEKKFEISDRLACSYKLLEEEANKCILVCANCHNEMHLADTGL